jgi:hypothetical protein
MNDAGGWRYVCASVTGVAHLAGGTDCQDACAAQLLSAPASEPVLVLVAADGAGSAARSRAGAELACRTLLAECAARLTDTAAMDWARTDAEALLQSVRTALAQQAADAGLPVREFACTLLGAVVATDHALFLQIGDGAIVIGAEGDYRPVFWPQTGEYANETHFATDPDAVDHLEWIALTEPVAEIALLTDGLQLLALHYRERQAHAPFFRPLFQRLREYPEPGCPAMLATALERFLASPAVNQRTHDDKTLILATRPPAVERESPLPIKLDTTTPTGTITAPDATAASEVADDLSDTDPEISHTDAADAHPDSIAPASLIRETDGDEAV